MELLNESPLAERSAATCYLVLPAALRCELEWAARRAYPCEACGFLLGESEAGRILVHAAKELRNAAQSYAREHYDIDPVEHLAVEKEAAERGLKVVGVWHSHPDRPAVASALDRANAATEWCYLILATARGGVADMRCWHLTQRTSNALAIFTAK